MSFISFQSIVNSTKIWGSWEWSSYIVRFFVLISHSSLCLNSFFDSLHQWLFGLGFSMHLPCFSNCHSCFFLKCQNSQFWICNVLVLLILALQWGIWWSLHIKGNLGCLFSLLIRNLNLNLILLDHQWHQEVKFVIQVQDLFFDKLNLVSFYIFRD